MKGKLFLCFTVLLILFSVSLLNAKSKNGSTQEETDMSLYEIDRLIRKTEYDEALRQLNIYLENYPERFDNAQSRIKKIMNARKQYSILAEKLINIIETDPSNSKVIYEITAQLEKFERHPSDKNLKFIADLKKSAEFNYFRALFMEIQQASAENTKQGKYVAAVEKAKEGFWLYRDDFYERWEDSPQITDSVDKILADLNLQVSYFEEKNYLSKINDSVNAFIKAVDQGQYQQALDRFEDVNNNFKGLAKIRNQIYADSVELQKIFENVRKLDSDTTDASFLPFLFRFVRGVDSVENSGITGAFDGYWKDSMQKMNGSVYAAVKKNYSKFESGVNTQYASDIKKYTKLENKVLNLYDYLVYEDKNHMNPLAVYYVYDSYLENLADSSVRLAEMLAQVDEETENQKKYLSEKSAQSVARLFDSVEKIGKLTGEKARLKIESYDWSENYRTSGFSEFDALEQWYNVKLDQVFEKSSVMLGSAWKEITDYYVLSSQNLVNDIESKNSVSEKYLSGLSEKLTAEKQSAINKDIQAAARYAKNEPVLEDEFELLYPYPLIAHKYSLYVSDTIKTYVKTIDGYEEIINQNFNAHSQWKNDGGIAPLVKQTDDYLENQKQKLRELDVQTKQIASNAQKQLASYEIAKNEADIRYQEAQNALKNENFDLARKKLQDALTKYDEALSSQSDEELRSSVDLKLMSLGERITKTENEIVVRDVRELKNKAKDAYFNGRFDDAEKYLNQARNRWAVTNTVPDEEISNLLNFVNTAISMNTGRDILPSAPQYPEMSQLLNIANQYYEEGEKLMKEGKTEEADAVLDKALTSIQKVQYVYPLNQKSSMLTLKINRLRNPQKFNDEFAQKIQVAKNMTKSASLRQEGYANLLDYYELDPDYKGLKDLIYQVEIDIGIRQKPVDNSASAKAKRLYSEAEKLFNSAGNDSSKLKNALAKIEQSLTLNPDNNSAMVLKDKITIKMGGNALSIWSVEDERLYQLAVQRLQNNNVVGADAVLQKILKNPANANLQKIKDLKNKIEARS